jgi:ABC-type bacteriocin/lantibiotic exporter with double-glycine peptidase domain
MEMKDISLKRIALVLACFMLYACASAPAVHDRALVIRNVPFFPQEDYQCGPASLAGVFNYLGLRTTPGIIAQDIFSKSAGGTLTIDMVLYAREKGFSAVDYSGSMNDLREKISAGSPLIVMVDYGFSVWQKNHFMVVTGYDDKGIVVNSGEEQGEFIGNDRFLRTWKKTGNWSLWIKKKQIRRVKP